MFWLPLRWGHCYYAGWKCLVGLESFLGYTKYVSKFGK